MTKTQLAMMTTVAVFFLGAVGCGGGDDSSDSSDTASTDAGPTDTGPGVEFKLPGGQTVKVGKDGSTTVEHNVGGVESTTKFGAAAKAPEGFPNELAYPGAKIEATQWTKFGDIGAGSVHFSTADSVSKVSEHYTKQLPTGGWTLQPNPLATANTDPDVAMHSATKDNLTTVLMLTKDKAKGGTTIAITLSPKE